MLGDWLYQLAEVVSTVTDPTPQKEKPDKAESKDKYKPNRANVHQNYYSGNKSNAENSTSVNQTKSDENCQICKKNCRKIEECSVFKSYNPEQRWKAMVESKVCRKCLRRHSGYCKSAKACGVNGCSCKHDRLLHDQAKHSAYTNEKRSSSSEVATQSAHHVHINSIPNVFYRIVPVTLYNKNQAMKVLAYLDEGSDLTLIERQLAAEMNLFGIPERLCLLWTAKVHRFEEKSAIVNLEISGQNEFTRRFKLLGVRTVEDLGLPEQTISKQMLLQKYQYLRDIPLIDYCGIPRIMIGLANARLCTQIQKLEGNEFEPIASRSRIGWSIHGPTREPNKNSTQKSYRILVCQKQADDEIYHKLVKEHFTIENFGVQVNNSFNAGSKDDERAVKLLQSYTKRTEGGFETGLLFKNEFIDLPDSYGMAKRRLICLEKQKPSRIRAIDDKIKDYIAKGYVSKLDHQEINAKNQRVWYLPIFTVVYPKKPNKIRLVFDAAAEVHGISLNKILLKGPDQVSSLVDILRRFREKRIAINGDIKEMFHQIKIRQEDRHLQRFLWRNGDESKEPDIYVLNVMSFGATCSPSSAQFVKNTNAMEFEKKHPQAVKSIIENHYVDDMMDGEHTEEKAIQLVKDVQEIHQRGGFEITKFISNSRKVMEAVGSKCENEKKCLDVDTALEIERVLGMYWNIELDCFNFSLKYTKIHQDVVEGNRYPTKENC